MAVKEDFNKKSLEPYPTQMEKNNNQLIATRNVVNE